MGLNTFYSGSYLDTVSSTCVNAWKVFLQSHSGQELSIPIKIHSVTWQNPKWLNQTGSSCSDAFSGKWKVGHCQTGTGQSAQKPEGACMKGLLKSLDSPKTKSETVTGVRDDNKVRCIVCACVSICIIQFFQIRRGRKRLVTWPLSHGWGTLRGHICLPIHKKTTNWNRLIRPTTFHLTAGVWMHKPCYLLRSEGEKKIKTKRSTIKRKAEDGFGFNILYRFQSGHVKQDVNPQWHRCKIQILTKQNDSFVGGEQHGQPHPSSVFLLPNTVMDALTIWETRVLKKNATQLSPRYFIIKIQLTMCMSSHQICVDGHLPGKTERRVNVICVHRWLTIWVPGPLQQLITRKQTHKHTHRDLWTTLVAYKNVADCHNKIISFQSNGE